MRRLLPPAARGAQLQGTRDLPEHALQKEEKLQRHHRFFASDTDAEVISRGEIFPVREMPARYRVTCMAEDADGRICGEVAKKGRADLRAKKNAHACGDCLVAEKSNKSLAAAVAPE